MYLKPITIKGITRLYFYESYYENKKSCSRPVESLGRLDELQKIYPDPIAHFKEVAIQKTEELKKSKDILITIDMDESMDVGGHANRIAYQLKSNF